MTAPMAGDGIGVLGAGSWGTALAIQLARAGQSTFLWGHHPEHVAALARDRMNQHYLPGVAFPPQLTLTADLQAVVGSCATLLLVVPSEAFRATLTKLAPLIAGRHRIVSATKGFEPGTGRLLHEVCADCLKSSTSFAALSGPTFAKEVAAGLPTAVTVASRDEQFCRELAERFRSESFRVYTSDDIVGVELGGAVKNVYAIAAGISDGLGFGANARVAVVTRSLAEMIRLGEALGGKRETFLGLAGVGDLMLTCTDNQSRNRRFGLAVGQGRSAQEAINEIGQVVEGHRSALEVRRRALALGLELPIAEQVYAVLYEQLPAAKAVKLLLEREQKAEVI